MTEEQQHQSPIFTTHLARAKDFVAYVDMVFEDDEWRFTDENSRSVEEQIYSFQEAKRCRLIYVSPPSVTVVTNKPDRRTFWKGVSVLYTLPVEGAEGHGAGEAV